MSVKVYTSPSCASCRKAKRWLSDFGINFIEKNIFVSKLNREELKAILEKTEHGFEDIISTRSKVFKERSVDINDMTINELLTFIEENPSVLKRPIIVDDRRLQIGYNDEEIRVFIPRELREHYNCAGCGYDFSNETGECGSKEECPNYEEDN